MKTFIVLFVIAVSLPADAQRVRENIRQRAGITQVQDSDSVSSEKIKEKKKDLHENRNAQRKK